MSANKKLEDLLPTKKRKVLVQANVDADLWELAHRFKEDRGVTWDSLVQAALRLALDDGKGSKR